MTPSTSSISRAAIAILLINLCLSTGLSAQADGTPIRLQTVAKPGKWITGQSGGITADSVTILPGNSRDTLRFGKSELARLEISQGQKSNAGRGALIGAGVGLVAGVVWIALFPWEDCEDTWGGTCAVLGSGVGLLTIGGGAAAGALIGAFSHREKWKAARLEPHASVGPRGVLHVGLGMTF